MKDTTVRQVMTPSNSGELITDLLMECVERLGNFPNATVNPRAWDHLSVYMPVKYPRQQKALMRFNPAFGTPNPYPSHAEQFREYEGDIAWLYNPWTGDKRHPSDIGSDTFGLLIIPDGEPVVAG